MARRKKNPIVRALTKKKLLKRAKKARGRRKATKKIRGNFRTPTVAAAKQYLSLAEKFSKAAKNSPLVRIRTEEATNIVKRFEDIQGKLVHKRQEKGLSPLLVKLVKSAKKGRGNFKRVTEKQAKSYLARVSRKHSTTKMSSYPFKTRVLESTVVLGEPLARKIVAKGQKERLRIRDSKIAKANVAINAALRDASAVVKEATEYKAQADQKYNQLVEKHKKLKKNRKQTEAKKVLAEIKKLVAEAKKRKKSLDAKYKNATDKLKAGRDEHAKVVAEYRDTWGPDRSVAARRRRTR